MDRLTAAERRELRDLGWVCPNCRRARRPRPILRKDILVLAVEHCEGADIVLQAGHIPMHGLEGSV